MQERFIARNLGQMGLKHPKVTVVITGDCLGVSFQNQLQRF